MQIQTIQGLSTKSRGILYRLMTNLAQHQLSIEKHICNIFDFRKEKFRKQDFQKIIRKYDQQLVLSQIDNLFDELDQSKNGFVFYEFLAKALTLIDEGDNPSLVLNKISKIKSKSKEDQAQFQVLIEIKDFLLKTQYYRQILDMFSTEQAGFLSQQNFKDILNNFGYDNEKKKDIAIKTFYSKKKIVPIKQILEKLGLEEDAKRINLLDFQPEENKMNTQSKIINEGIKKSKINPVSKIKTQKSQESFHFFVPNENQEIISIENIPTALQHYFNYGSELQQTFGYLAAQYIETNTVFIDPENPMYSKAKGLVHISEINPHYNLFQKAKSVIHRNRKGLGQMLEPKDIIQGNLGDCYFLSALAAIVHDYPQLVYRLLVLQKNPSHMFGVRLFIEGIWKTIPLDGTFPISHHQTYCGAQPHQNQIWVMLLQKAWAKCFGSYDNIHSGYNEQGLVAISGAPTIIVSSRTEGFIKKIEAQFTKGSIVTCATSSQVTQLTPKQQEQLGVFSGHAYTILGTYTDLPYKNKSITLIKVRNPWGRKAWKKDWSYSSPLWTKQLRQVLNFNVDPKDGTFFISFDDFLVYFDHINISRVNLGFHHSWRTNHGNRYEFYQNRVTIKEKGDYFFTLYQQNKRRYKNSGSVFQKSRSYLFIAKIVAQTQYGEIKKLEAVAFSAKNTQDNTIETTLDSGIYLILSSVNWNYWDSHPYNLTSYGVGKVQFTEGLVAGPDLITQMITSKSEQVAQYGSSPYTMYNNLNISKTIYYSIEEGVGFITITNHDKVMLQTTISLNPCHGLQLIPPFQLPLKFSVLPFQTVVCPILVDPKGYNFKMGQKYNVAHV